MDLQHILEETLNKIAGANYVSCVGMDGIALSQAIKEVPFDPAILDAEIANLVGYSLKACESINGGDFEEILFSTDKYLILARKINKDAFLIVALSEIKNLGLARIQAKKATDQLKKVLE